MGGWALPVLAGQIPEKAAQLALETQKQQAGLRSLALQSAIQRQVAQENALKIQAMKEDQEDQGTIHQAIKDSTDPGGKIDIGQVMSAAGPKIRLRNLQALQKWDLDQKRSYLELDNDSRVAAKNAFDLIGSGLVGVQQSSNPEQRQSTYDSMRSALGKLNLQRLGIDVATWPQQVPEKNEDLEALGATAGVGKYLADWHDEQAQRKQRDAAAARADAQARKATDEDEIRKDQTSTTAAAARLSLALTGEEYNSILSSLDGKTKSKFPQLPADSDPSKPLNREFMDNVRRRGLSAQQLTQEQEKTTTEADRVAAQRSARHDAAAKRWGSDIAAALIAGGASDPSEPTPAEMTKALDKVQADKIRVSLASKPPSQSQDPFGGLFGGGGGAQGGGGGFHVTDPTGKVHVFPTQQQADAFKKAAGIK